MMNIFMYRHAITNNNFLIAFIRNPFNAQYLKLNEEYQTQLLQVLLLL